jgi:hypothetical protein
MDYPTSLSSITPREAVAYAMYRAVVAIDDNKPELFESAMVQSEETTFEVIGGRTIQGMKAINAHIVDRLMPMKTTHSVTNVRGDLKDGADTAHLTATVIANHYRPDDTYAPESKACVTGGLYSVNLVMDSSDGLRKIIRWTLQLNWTKGDRSVIIG